MKFNPDTSTIPTGLFGFPVGHSISPRIHNRAFFALGLDWIYLAFEVHPDSLKTALGGFRALGGRGLNITIPHKEAVVPFLDSLSRPARMIGAVNTVSFGEEGTRGYNTDGPGFAAAVREEIEFSFSNSTIAVIGAGGAGRAVAVQSVLEGARKVYVTDLDREKAEDLSGWINARLPENKCRPLFPDEEEWNSHLKSCRLVVDATPLGLKKSDPVSFDLALLEPTAAVMDLVYNPPRTPLLKAARERGIRGINGLGMLIHQAALAFEIWTGEEAPVDVMREAAEETLYGNPKSEIRMTKEIRMTNDE